MREDRVRVYLCCVSCHLCVRAHHRNCEACAHTSTITLLSAGHQHMSPNHQRHSFSQTFGYARHMHTCSSTQLLSIHGECIDISEPVASILVYKKICIFAFFTTNLSIEHLHIRRTEPKPNVYQLVF